ncbi:MAG: T9SS type A sorting domain-containing protein [Bacteroidia bacterium]
MQKKIFITLSVVFTSLIGYSQSMFQKVFEKDFTTIYGAQQTNDGGYIMGGLHQVSATDFDYLAVKLNSVGDTLWTKTYGGIGDEECYAMQQTADGGFIFAGIDSSSGIGNYNVYLVKTNSIGDTLWTKSYGGSSDDFGQAVQQTADGGYIVAGYTGSFSADGNNDVYLLKTDANGNLTWSKTYGGAYGDYAFAVKQTTDGGYIISGTTSSFGISPYGNVNDVYVLKTNSSGVLTWSKTYGQDGDDWSYGIVQTNEGGYALTGHTNIDSTAALSDVYLIKMDANGDTLFTKSFGGSNYDKGTAIIQTNDSGFVVTGSTYSFGHGTSDVYLLKTNKKGSLLFNSTFGSAGNDWAYALSQATDNGFVLAGYTDNFGVGNSSFYFVKTDNYGRGNNCNETTPATVIGNTITKVSNAATITNTPATITKQNTFTKITSGVSVIDVCNFTTSIKQQTNKQLFAVYPNPSNGNFAISTADLKENTQVIIYNQLGQIVLSKSLNNQLTNFNLDVNAGVYQVRILNENEVIFQTKIIKE